MGSNMITIRPGADMRGGVRLNPSVITSYSIHYTKLYEDIAASTSKVLDFESKFSSLIEIFEIWAKGQKLQALNEKAT